MQQEAPVITVRHAFDAAADLVFDAWIDPAVASRWLFATPDGQNVRCDIDPCVGGAFVITDRRWLLLTTAASTGPKIYWASAHLLEEVRSRR